MTTYTDEIKRLFIDTSAWIALMNKKEQHYAAALTFHQSLDPSTIRITSWGGVAETFTWILYHIGQREASRWLDMKDALEKQGILQVVFLYCNNSVSTRYRCNICFRPSHGPCWYPHSTRSFEFKKMSINTRPARLSDAPAIVDLSEQKRTQYQVYQPTFWRKDELCWQHRASLLHLNGTCETCKRQCLAVSESIAGGSR